jgi:hypothetical protein
MTVCKTGTNKQATERYKVTGWERRVYKKRKRGESVQHTYTPVS